MDGAEAVNFEPAAQSRAHKSCVHERAPRQSLQLVCVLHDGRIFVENSENFPQQAQGGNGAALDCCQLQGLEVFAVRFGSEYVEGVNGRGSQAPCVSYLRLICKGCGVITVKANRSGASLEAPPLPQVSRIAAANNSPPSSAPAFKSGECFP